MFRESKKRARGASVSEAASRRVEDRARIAAVLERERPRDEYHQRTSTEQPLLPTKRPSVCASFIRLEESTRKRARRSHRIAPSPLLPSTALASSSPSTPASISSGDTTSWEKRNDGAREGISGPGRRPARFSPRTTRSRASGNELSDPGSGQGPVNIPLAPFRAPKDSLVRATRNREELRKGESSRLSQRRFALRSIVRPHVGDVSVCVYEACVLPLLPSPLDPSHDVVVTVGGSSMCCLRVHRNRKLPEDLVLKLEVPDDTLHCVASSVVSWTSNEDESDGEFQVGRRAQADDGAPAKRETRRSERLIATGGVNGAIRVISFERHHCFLRLEYHSAEVNSVGFVPADPTTLLSCSSDQTLCIWRLSYPCEELICSNPLNVFPCREKLIAMDVSPCSSYAITAGHNIDTVHFHIWDVRVAIGGKTTTSGALLLRSKPQGHVVDAVSFCRSNIFVAKMPSVGRIYVHRLSDKQQPRLEAECIQVLEHGGLGSGLCLYRMSCVDKKSDGVEIAVGNGLSTIEVFHVSDQTLRSGVHMGREDGELCPPSCFAMHVQCRGMTLCCVHAPRAECLLSATDCGDVVLWDVVDDDDDD